MEEGALVSKVPVGRIRCHTRTAGHFPKHDGGRPTFAGEIRSSSDQRTMEIAMAISSALSV